VSLFFDYEFDAPIAEHDVGSDRYRYTVVYVPGEILAELPMAEYPRLRIAGEVNDHPFEASITPAKGVWYVLFSKRVLKAIGAEVGDNVSIRFRVADQDAVDVPAALGEALGDDTRMRTLWDAQTPGKRRALAYRVASAKTEATQSKRVVEVFDILDGRRDLRGKLIE